MFKFIKNLFKKKRYGTISVTYNYNGKSTEVFYEVKEIGICGEYSRIKVKKIYGYHSYLCDKDDLPPLYETSKISWIN